ncbi:hypothetical protein [Candidatus Hodarchaeum mangrovi]
MIFIWNLNSIIVGFLFGLVMAIGLGYISDELVTEMREESPNDELINSVLFYSLFKYLLPLLLVIGFALLIGPFFTWFYEQILLQESIFGLNPKLVYIGGFLLFSLLLDFAVFLTRTPYPLMKLIANSWMFLMFGLLIPVLVN